MDYEKLIKKARNTIADMEQSERNLTEFCIREGVDPAKMPVGDDRFINAAQFTTAAHDEQLRTAITAIRAGISCDNWDIVAEGQCMLADLHKAMTGKPYLG